MKMSDAEKLVWGLAYLLEYMHSDSRRHEWMREKSKAFRRDQIKSNPEPYPEPSETQWTEWERQFREISAGIAREFAGNTITALRTANRDGSRA